MFCPRCGNIVDVESYAFCPKCGYFLNTIGTFDSKQQQYSKNSPNTRKKKSSAGKVVAFSMVIILLGAVFVTLFNDVEEEQDVFEIQAIGEDSYFELRGDFLETRGILTVGFDGKGGVDFKIASEYTSNSQYYYWNFFDSDMPASSTENKFTQYRGKYLKTTEPKLNHPTLGAGDYRIAVSCFATNDINSKPVATFSGSVIYVDSVTEEYSWTYLGKEYSTEISFNYDDYRKYKQMNPDGRNVTNYQLSTSFITYKDPVIVSLASSLLTAYGKGTSLDQEFASFILAFIQLEFDYPPHKADVMGADKYLYGQNEYFAYPLETIFHGMGDCEDTSILAAAIYKALGFETGVVLIPGHAVAAVGLDSYSPGTYSSLRYEILSKRINGVTYYGCETTVSSFQQVGLITSSGYEDRPYSYYIGKSGYGFFIV